MSQETYTELGFTESVDKRMGLPYHFDRRVRRSRIHHLISMQLEKVGQDPWRLVMLLVATSVEINTMITASYGGFGGLGQE